MAFGQDRQMYDVDVNCAECGTHIAQLPFPYDPSNGRPVYCTNCLRKRRDDRGGDRGGRGGFGNGPRAPRQMFQGNWKCATCGTEITELPFQPSGDKPIYCREHLPPRPPRDNY